MSDLRTHPGSHDPRDLILSALGLEGLLEATPDLAFACDAAGTLLWASREFEALMGQPLSESVGRPVLSLLPTPARRRVLQAIAGQRRHRTPGFEVTVPLSDTRGGGSDVTAHVRRWEHPDGGFVFAGTAHGTRAIAAAGPAGGAPPVATPEPATACQEGLEAENRQASEVLAAMDRELRAPMNAMIGMARLLLQTSLDEEQQALADGIWRSGQATLRLVNDACALTRAEPDQLELDHIAFDLRVTIDETVASLASLAAEKGLELVCRVHPAVPSRLRGDPGRLRQVLQNLGERAIRTAVRDRIEVLVSRLRESDESVTLRFLVMEQGAGTKSVGGAGEAPQSSRRPDAEPGGAADAGLGLAVARRLVGLMGGKTGVEGSSADGHRHWFDVDLEKQGEFESTAGPHLSKVELATRRALIVDPSAVARRTLRNRLEGAGCRAAEARDAEEAHALLRAAVESGDPFHFVLIDRDLPGPDGEELGAIIRADHALDVARTVMLTTVGRRGDAARAQARGFSAFLPKALGPEELVEALCEVVRLSMAPAPGGVPELVTRYSLAEGRRSKTRILLVDDDAVNQVVTRWCLSRLGYRLDIAGTLADARSAWTSGAFDMVLVDELLVDGDALALARELRRHEGDGRHAAVIGMFRGEDSPARLEWQAAGMAEFVVKPVDLVALTGLVERVTGTGLPSGAATDDEEAGRSAGRTPPPGEGRLEFVMPDVDRIMTEAEVQAAMVAAMSASTGAPMPATSAAARPILEGLVPEESPAADVTPAAQPESAPAPVPEPSTLLPQDVVPLDAHEPPAAESAVEAPAVSESPAAESEVEAPAAPEPPVVECAVETPDVPEPPAAECVVEAFAGPELVCLSGEAGERSDGPAPTGSPGVGSLELVEAPAQPAAPVPAAAVDLGRLEQASMGISSLRTALLSTFLGEIDPFLERLSWALSDEDAKRVAADAHGLAVLSRSIGAIACAAALEELVSRGADGTLTVGHPILRRCYGLGLGAATEVRGLLAEERRAA